MTDSSPYLIARLNALRELLQATQEASAPDPRTRAADWRTSQPQRLERYHQNTQRLRQSAESNTSALARLALRCNLEPLDEDLLLLALAPALERSVGQLLGSLRRSFSADKLDVDLALSLLTPDLPARLTALARLKDDAPLLRHGLLTLKPGRGAAGPMTREMSAPGWVQRTLLGLGGQRQGAFWQRTPTDQTLTLDQVMVPLEARQRLDALLATHRALCDRRDGPALLLISGPAGTGKTTLAHAIGRHLGRPLLSVDALALSARTADPGGATLELVAEARLEQAVIFFDDAELLFGSRLQGNRALPAMLTALETVHDLIIITTSHEDLLDPTVQRRILLRVGLENPSPSGRHTLWQRALPGDIAPRGDLDLEFIAEKYEFTGAQIQQAGAMATAYALERLKPGAPVQDAWLDADDIDRAAQAQIRHHLAQLAVRTTSHLTLDDVVLPQDLLTTIRSIIAAVRNRRRIFEDWGFGEKLTTGKGITMLFRGESGTGKTLSAEIVAAELSMPIYRVAIPRIVSKYIGETEENLEKAFREAQVARAVLLFDEADAIFTKRVDVGTATDRYSNMEVNLLLQELERFEGVVVLTTNHDAAIDDAFERRLNYKLDFPFPEASLRQLIWTRHLPDKAPVELHDEELEYLAERFELSGGSIKNVVVRAAYAAAEGRRKINIDLLEEAAIQEYRELGKLVPS